MQARMRTQVRCCLGLEHDRHTWISRIPRRWQMSSADNSSPSARTWCLEWVMVIACCWNSCWHSHLKQLPHQNTAGGWNTRQVIGKGTGKGNIVTTVTEPFFTIPKISQKWRCSAAQGATGDRSWYLPFRWPAALIQRGQRCSSVHTVKQIRGGAGKGGGGDCL